MKVLSLSNRFYYRELDEEVREVIKHDLKVYNSMLHKAYKLLYDKSYKNVPLKESLQKMMKNEYGTTDYIPLSAINEAKSLLKANTQTNQRLIKQSIKRISRIKYKIKSKENEIDSYTRDKNQLIKKCKEMDYTEKDYLYECKIDKKLKEAKNQLKQIYFRLNREIQRKNKLERGSKAVCFGSKKNLRNDINEFRYQRNKRMLIAGRRQGKYSNNLFKYHVDENIMVYRGIEKEIRLPITFHKNKEYLENAVRMKHNTPNKAVAYELYDHGDYFIIKAIIEVESQLTKPSIYGSIGIDINADHIATAEIDAFGNLVKAKTYKIHKYKNRNKREYERYCIIKKIVDNCIDTNKHLVIEDLNFDELKSESLYNNKRRNRMLSNFAYSRLKEKIERKCSLEGVHLEIVDPSYTSQIGKLKYTKRLGLSIHHSAAYTIARRGSGYSERIPNEYREFKRETNRKEQWKDIVKVLGKATLQECQFTPYLCLFR